MNSTENLAVNRWPAQVRYIVGNEACERFSYYGMRSILAGYITGAVVQGGLGQTADRSTEIIHTFVSANYFMPLFGAWLSDKLIGRYHTILWVSLFYCAGHGVLACSDFASGVDGKLWCLFLGLGLIAFGSGGIKPCVSAFMGDQFKPEQSHLLQKAYGAFYWSINLGSFFSFLVVPWVKNHHGYSWAFGVPGILMAIATVIFWAGTKHYVRVPPSRETKSAGFFKVFWHALKAPKAGKSFWDAARNRFTDREVDAARSVLPILGVFLLVPPFWSLFDQTNSTWVLQGGQMIPFILGGKVLLAATTALLLSLAILAIRGREIIARWFFIGLNGVAVLITALALTVANRQELTITVVCLASAAALLIAGIRAPAAIVRILFAAETLFFVIVSVISRERLLGVKFKIGAEEMQSANPALVMILVPLLTLLIYPRLRQWASPLRRMSYGMFLAAVSYVIVAGLQQRLEAGAQMSVAWQIVPYIVLTTAEVLVSTTGLEFAFREAAAEMKSLIMSFWLLTVTVGNLLVALITKFLTDGSGVESVTSGRFLLYAGLSFVVAIIFSVVTSFYRYRDAAAARGE